MEKGNAPFAIGQKVVVTDLAHTGKVYAPWLIKPGMIGEVLYMEYAESYTQYGPCDWYVETSLHPGVVYLKNFFAPIQSVYSDATAEILEKYQPCEGGSVDVPVKEVKEVGV